jgi:hypothetical protein
LKFYKSTTMKARDTGKDGGYKNNSKDFVALHISQGVMKGERRLFNIFSTIFPHVFHNEKVKFDNSLGKFSTKRCFPIFFQQQGRIFLGNFYNLILNLSISRYFISIFFYQRYFPSSKFKGEFKFYNFSRFDEF